MAKLPKIPQNIFASTAGTDQIAEFGSLFAGAPAFTTDPNAAQSLSNWLGGWAEAAIGGSDPAYEDMNAVFFEITYQLACIVQQGILEWDAVTVYFKGSQAKASDGSGAVYTSVTDNNQNNALSDATNWKIQGGNLRTVMGTDTALVTDDIVLLNPTGGTFVETLPTVASAPKGKRLIFKNIATNGTAATLKGNGAELIDQANTLVLNSAPVWDSVTVVNSGTQWLII